MAKNEESGRYAIAGFQYQFVGSGIEALEIHEGLRTDQEPTELLAVERFGQDAAVLPVALSAQQKSED